MSLQQTKQQGFTIVELLIVIVVIAILAAISIVAYTGITNRGKASAAKSAASTIAKKADVAYAIASTYPTSKANFDAQSDSSLAGSGVTLAAIATAPSSPATVEYQTCTAGDSGARVAYWDYSANAKSSYQNLGSTAACTTWSSAVAITAY